MNQQAFCPECHSPLPSDAPEGLCPRCLMKLGVNAQSTGSNTGGSVIRTGTNLDLSEPLLMKPAQDVDLTATVGIHESPGRYSQLGEYSRGGMGRILLVHDQTIGRDVALKELLPESRGGPEGTPVRHSTAVVARFLREAQLTGQLEHPSIVPVYEVGRRSDGKLYYTMKLVRGKTLRDAIAETKTLGERLKLLPHVVDLCQAMAYAHSRGVIHRDLKPRNVMVGEFGETVVIDWGLAKARGEADASARDSEMAERVLRPADSASAYETEDGTVLGTAAYMPPEQAAGDVKSTDERSDVYSLGAVLYEVLTGRPPFTGTSAQEVVDKVVAERPTPVLQIERRVAPELAAICERAMARDPADRHASAKELADDIQAFITGRVFREREARVSFLAAIYGLGAALIAAGVITLVAYNWKHIPAHGQAALIMATMLALLGSGLHFWKISASRPQLGHALVFLGVIMLGIDLLLLCRIYHIPLSGNWGLAGPNKQALAMHENILFLLWAIGGFAVACAVRSNPVTVISLVASFLWFFEEFVAFSTEPLMPQVYFYPIIIAALFLPAGYRWANGKSIALLVLAVALSCVLIASVKSFLYGPKLVGALLSIAALVFPWGLLSYTGANRRRVGYPALGLGLVFLAIPDAVLSMWRGLDIFYDARAFPVLGLERYLPVALACLIAAVLWAIAAMRDFGSREVRALAKGFVIVTLLSVGTLATGCFFASRASIGHGSPIPSTEMLVVFAVANLAILILGGSITWAGVALLNRRVFWSGILFVTGMAVMHIFEIDMNFQYQAFFLVCAGLGLIAVGMRFESHLKKRRLV